jgi:phospholipid/cholesterol/gamma-HCH transport system substrate-binding protein
VNLARRVGAILAVLVVAIVVIVLLMSGGPSYKLKLDFQNASQLVKGDLVQVAGTTVGKVNSIALTPNGQAQIGISIDSDYAPLRQGTIAIVRVPSLSGIANRFIDLQQGPMRAPAIPNGSTLPAQDTESAIDLDQLFNVFDPKTRAATRQLIRGLADTTQGHTAEANQALHYLNPVLSASARLFDEVDRDRPALERFVVQTSHLVTDVAAKNNDLSGIVTNFGQVSTALASESPALANAIHRLPEFLRKSNSTFVNLRATLDDLDPLVNASKPVVRKLRPLLANLRGFARDARPTLRDLADTIRRPGSGNDLVELLNAQPALAKRALDPQTIRGKKRRAAFPETVDALNGATPELAFARPYAPELTGWFDDFSTSGDYDALGAFSRAGLALSAFTVTPALGLVPVPPELRSQVFAAGASVGRNNRCPGSNERTAPDHSNPFVPSPSYPCDPSIKPIGP